MKKRVFRRIIVFALFLISISGFTGCERIQEAYGMINRPPPQPPIPVYAVNVMTAGQGSISDYISFAGDVMAASSVDVFSDIAGRVNRLSVSVGSRVNRGDLIATVDPSRPGMEFIPSAVRATISGTVVSLPAQLGMTVSQAVPIARIAGGSALEIRLNIAERFISRVGMGQTCEITLDAWPGEIFYGRISEVSPVVDPASRTMEIRITIGNHDFRLKAGMFAKVRIITEQKNNIVKLPSSAMIQRFGEDYVYVAVDDPENEGIMTAQKRIIVPGIQIDGMMEVVQGLMPGDDVIVRGQSLLNDGSRINIVERLAPLN